MSRDRRNQQITPGATIILLATATAVSDNTVVARLQNSVPGSPDQINVPPGACLVQGNGVEVVTDTPTPSPVVPTPEPSKPVPTPAPLTLQERVVEEKTQLDERISKLGTFISGNPMFGTLPEAEQERLKFQFTAMGNYSSVLGDRIKHFAVAPVVVTDDAQETFDPKNPRSTLSDDAALPAAGAHVSDEFAKGRVDGMKGNHDAGNTSEDYKAGFAEGVKLREEEEAAHNSGNVQQAPQEAAPQH